MRMNRILLAMSVLILGITLMLPGLSASNPNPLPKEISLATHYVGSMYNVMGIGLAKVLTNKSPIKVTVKPFAGPNAWMPLLEKGDVDMGACSVLDEGWAYAGTFGYAEKARNLRILVWGQPIVNNLPLVVKKGSDIYKVEDLRGKRVASRYGANAIVQNIVTATLWSGGLAWNDVKQVPVATIGQALDLLKQRQVDACFGSVGIAQLEEAHAAVGIRPISFGKETPAVMKKFHELLPGATIGPLKAGAAPYVTEDIKNVVHWTTLNARAGLEEEAAYVVVKTLWENYKDLQPLSPWLKAWTADKMFQTNPVVPYHPGAVKFFKEKNLWTREMETLQQRLLAGR
jgi:TRAP transporter TAXI family solute receptor